MSTGSSSGGFFGFLDPVCRRDAVPRAPRLLPMRPLRALFLALCCAAAHARWEVAVGAASCCAALGLACSVRIISTGSEALVERLGKFDRRLSPGLNFIVPGLENVSIRASVREQVLFSTVRASSPLADGRG